MHCDNLITETEFASPDLLDKQTIQRCWTTETCKMCKNAIIKCNKPNKSNILHFCYITAMSFLSDNYHMKRRTEEGGHLDCLKHRNISTRISFVTVNIVFQKLENSCIPPVISEQRCKVELDLTDWGDVTNRLERKVYFLRDNQD